MANIVDPAAISFCNTKVRPTADVMLQMYWTAKSIIATWNALTMSGKIPNDASVIVDGAATDGRNIINGIQATAIITQATNFVATFEAGGNAVLNVITQVAVNGGSRIS
jgi:peptidoglycan hydrolase-like protein with peptidoglycan-binding domain